MAKEKNQEKGQERNIKSLGFQTKSKWPPGETHSINSSRGVVFPLGLPLAIKKQGTKPWGIN